LQIATFIPLSFYLKTQALASFAARYNEKYLRPDGKTYARIERKKPVACGWMERKSLHPDITKNPCQPIPLHASGPFRALKSNELTGA
jgi:hypothetical protein